MKLLTEMHMHLNWQTFLTIVHIKFLVLGIRTWALVRDSDKLVYRLRPLGSQDGPL